jgi:4-hydroxy-tetrahydrodipicolinate reductase
MVDVAIIGDGRLARALAHRLRSDGVLAVRGPAARSERRGLLTSGADVVIIATSTLLADVADDIRAAVSAGSNVLVSAEEAAHPWAVDAVLGEELDQLAREAGVTVLGAGLNPGFLFDALVITLSGLHATPTSIAVSRVVDLSGFGPAVRARLGLGYDRSGFTAGLADGSILGHAGFRQSMAVVAATLGVIIDRIDAEVEPVFDAGGTTAGFVQHYLAFVGGSDWFRAEFTGHIAPQAAGLVPRDAITIESDAGTTHSVIEPGVPSLAGSVSLIANSIRRVIAAPPGWRTVAELPPAHPASPTEVVR